MLVEFRVANFRSVMEEQVLSFVASNDKTAADTHLIDTGVKGLSKLTRSAVLYGPNASGKSTVLAALDYLRQVVTQSATIIQPGANYNVQPFRLNAKTATEPSRLEVTFILEGVRHQYGFTIAQERIVDEWLLVYRTAKPQRWFQRIWNSKTQSHDYEFSPHLAGARKLWQDSTRANALFLSTAAQLNSESLGPVFSWITQSAVYFAAGATPVPDFTTGLLKTDEGRQMVREFMLAADTGIVDVEAVARKGFRQTIAFNPFAGGVAQVVQEEGEVFVPLFKHSTESSVPAFELQDESSGTQRLYALAEPVMSALSTGNMLVVDELDGSLHSHLVRHLVRLFHNPDVNAKGAQLLFSTHDTSLLDAELFRRDQIWFTEKDTNGATRLYPFSEFSPRKAEAWERGYLAGRYGAVPLLRSTALAAAKAVA